MKNKFKLLSILSEVILLSILCGCSDNKKNTGKDEEIYQIGINQIVQHSALDSAREGFIDGLREKGYVDGDNIKIDYENAQGDVSIAQTISKQFVNNGVDMIFAISTSSAQSAYNATKEIPIVFTAVTDPVAAGIANSFESSGNNVTGMSDMVSMTEQIALLQDIIPSIEKIGVIYNTSEANSIVQVDELKSAAKERNLEVKEISITTVNEINQNLSANIKDIDALYIPTDNTVASAYELVGSICLNNNIPMLCAEEAGVSKGGLCSIGIDYYKLGKEAGYKAVKVIEGMVPSEIKIEKSSDMTVTINSDVAKRINIEIPKEIEENAQIVTGGVN